MSNLHYWRGQSKCAMCEDRKIAYWIRKFAPNGFGRDYCSNCTKLKIETFKRKINEQEKNRETKAKYLQKEWRQKKREEKYREKILKKVRYSNGSRIS